MRRCRKGGCREEGAGEESRPGLTACAARAGVAAAIGDLAVVEESPADKTMFGAGIGPLGQGTPGRSGWGEQLGLAGLGLVALAALGLAGEGRRRAGAGVTAVDATAGLLVGGPSRGLDGPRASGLGAGMSGRAGDGGDRARAVLGVGVLAMLGAGALFSLI
ncbi:hypothetical protein V8F33_000903 [Rhypophila sp. PSN 637]